MIAIIKESLHLDFNCAGRNSEDLINSCRNQQSLNLFATVLLCDLPHVSSSV